MVSEASEASGASDVRARTAESGERVARVAVVWGGVGRRVRACVVKRWV